MSGASGNESTAYAVKSTFVVCPAVVMLAVIRFVAVKGDTCTKMRASPLVSVRTTHGLDGSHQPFSGSGDRNASSWITRNSTGPLVRGTPLVVVTRTTKGFGSTVSLRLVWLSPLTMLM